MSLSFGSSSKKQKSKSQPFFTNTGYSSYSGKTFNLDPSIREGQDSARQKYASIYGDVGQSTDRYLGQIGGLRERFGGSEGDITQAIVNPALRTGASLVGQTQRNVGLRGLGGSSFGQQAMTNAQRDASMMESEARGKAATLVADFEKNLSDSELNALNQKAQMQAQLTGEDVNIIKMRLAQEMGIFQLGTKGQASGSGTDTGFGFGLSGGGGSPFINWGGGR
jgi:hypothetical protein